MRKVDIFFGLFFFVIYPSSVEAERICKKPTALQYTLFKEASDCIKSNRRKHKETPTHKQFDGIGSCNFEFWSPSEDVDKITEAFEFAVQNKIGCIEAGSKKSAGYLFSYKGDGYFLYFIGSKVISIGMLVS